MARQRSAIYDATALPRCRRTKGDPFPSLALTAWCPGVQQDAANSKPLLRTPSCLLLTSLTKTLSLAEHHLACPYLEPPNPTATHPRVHAQPRPKLRVVLQQQGLQGAAGQYASGGSGGQGARGADGVEGGGGGGGKQGARLSSSHAGIWGQVRGCVFVLAALGQKQGKRGNVGGVNLVGERGVLCSWRLWWAGPSPGR